MITSGTKVYPVLVFRALVVFFGVFVSWILIWGGTRLEKQSVYSSLYKLCVENSKGSLFISLILFL